MDYTRNQASWTLLYKKKVTLSTGEEEILYERLKKWIRGSNIKSMNKGSLAVDKNSLLTDPTICYMISPTKKGDTVYVVLNRNGE